MIPNIKPDGFISNEDYIKMKDLGIDDPERYLK